MFAINIDNVELNGESQSELNVKRDVLPNVKPEPEAQIAATADTSQTGEYLF